MRLKSSALSLILLCASTLAMAETFRMTIKDLIETEQIKAILDPAIHLYWGDEQMPEFVEASKPEVHSGNGIKVLFFIPGQEKHCAEGFEKSLRSMISDARQSGFDSVFNIRPVVDGKPSDDVSGFDCTTGVHVTTVQMSSQFGARQETFKRRAEAEQAAQLAAQAARAPAKNAVFVPLAVVSASAELASIVGKDITLSWGLEPVGEYFYRYGPDVSSAEFKLEKSGTAEACRRAALVAVRQMVEDARERGYQRVVNIRSYLGDAFSPDASNFECAVGKQEVALSFRATLVSPK